MVDKQTPPPTPFAASDVYTLDIVPMSDKIVSPVIRDRSLVVHAFGFTEDGRSKSAMVPPNASRHIETRLRVKFGHLMLPLVATPEWMRSKFLLCLGFTTSLEDELLITVLSTHPTEAMYIQHGNPLAILHFVRTIDLRVKGLADG